MTGLGLRAAPSLLQALGFSLGQAPGGGPTLSLPNLRVLTGESRGPCLLLHSPGPLPDTLDGVPCSILPVKGGGAGGWGEAALHPNGVTRCDHLVIRSPDWRRTSLALQEVGWQEARVREDVYPGTRLSFFRVGGAGRGLTLELVAPIKPKEDGGPAHLWGVTWVAGQGLEAVAASLGGQFSLSASRAAVQPGRNIATLRGETGALGMAMAFLTPKEMIKD